VLYLKNVSAMFPLKMIKPC